jgi:adenine-specific DNA-methyltransferase
MPPKKKPATPKPPTPITAVKHKDKRANIPTEELRDFVADEEKKPKTILYPRDPSLDPQLVWKGKDEQDRADLAVPAVPIYIQEKIQPLAIIENVRAVARKDTPAQASLFNDFNGIGWSDLIEFYQHEQSWSNRMILGDSLMVMTSLAEKEGLKGKVQMMYFDPPYGIKFGSNWQVSCNLTHNFAAVARLCFQSSLRCCVMHRCNGLTAPNRVRAERHARRPSPWGDE